ncbi:MAG: 4-(cytidine 5'-diphospho)-2-C-methyl-D-erythritol kinase [Campylobacterota bacterium]
MKSYKAYAKVNIFLKVTGVRGDYHELLSRFVLVNDLYDTLTFISKKNDNFVIEGAFNCETKQNTIYKAYLALYEATGSDSLKRLMQSHAIKVEKKIPSFAGLGGGSSDAATYLLMCNEVLHLGLSRDELALIGAKVGADVPFFVYGYQSANVSGIGEIVNAFDEPALNIKTVTPNIEISTPKVYQGFREHFYKELSEGEQKRLSKLTSVEVLKEMTPLEANDLFEPALLLYPELKKQHQEGWFFSGSGSSFFTVS